MKSGTRNRLLLAAVVALVLVLAAWWATLPRPTYAYANTLVQIVYDTANGPQLTYVFSAPLSVGVSSTGDAVDPAFLRSFTITGVAPGGDTEAQDAGSLVSALLQSGKQGGTPFVPEVNPGLTALTTSSVPPDAVKDGYPPLTISGYGTMAFVTN